MSLEDLLKDSTLSPKTCGKLQDLDELSRRINDLANDTNSTVLHGDVDEFYQGSVAQSEWLALYQERFADVFPKIEYEDPENAELYEYLIRQIQQLSEQIRINTTLNLQTIRAMSERITDQATGRGEGGFTCH